MCVVQVSIVSVHLYPVRAVVKSEKRDLSLDGLVNSITVTELGNMTGDKFEQYFTSGLHTLHFIYLLLFFTPGSKKVKKGKAGRAPPERRRGAHLAVMAVEPVGG